MNGRTKPGTAWSQGLGLWCRLWQVQIDASLKFWAAWAVVLPRPDARALAAEAERRADPAVVRERVARRPAGQVPAKLAQAAQAAPTPTLH